MLVVVIGSVGKTKRTKEHVKSEPFAGWGSVELRSTPCLPIVRMFGFHSTGNCWQMGP